MSQLVKPDMHIDSVHVDSVLIEGLSLDASIGVFEWEKQIKQGLVFDVALYGDFSKAAKSDAIQDTVDYSAVCSAIQEILQQQHYNLLEYLAERIARTILDGFTITAVGLTIYKPGAVTNTKQVGVRIYREKTCTPGSGGHDDE